MALGQLLAVQAHEDQLHLLPQAAVLLDIACMRVQGSKAIVPQDPSLYELLEDCQPFYALLASKSLRPLLLLPHEGTPSEPPPLDPAAAGGGTSAGIGGGPGGSRGAAVTSLGKEAVPALSLPRFLDPPLPVPGNRQLLVWVGDSLLPRNQAKVPGARIKRKRA